jgi:hypothetical protein
VAFSFLIQMEPEGLVELLQRKKLYEVLEAINDGSILFEECMMMTEQQWHTIAKGKGFDIYNYLHPSKSVLGGC